MGEQKKNDNEFVIDFGHLNLKQEQFIDSTTRFTGYGGARGGGKTHVSRIKAVSLAIGCAGIRILCMRSTYPELLLNWIEPIKRLVPNAMASYNDQKKMMTFYNGSLIKFGNVGNDFEKAYQGQEYDVIFIDEATHFTWRQFSYLRSINRGSNPDFPRRMYLTANPGGVGHSWYKRIFIDRDFVVNDPDPEKNENPNDYTFIFATVEDNPDLLKADPDYVKQLAALPEDLQRAHRYGDWSVLSGNYFKDFSIVRHTAPPFSIPRHWQRYRSLDYGFDMLAVHWFAIDEDGRSWCYRELNRPGLAVADAAKAIIDNTPPNENIVATYAPDDLRSRSKDSGKSVEELFVTNGVPLVIVSRNRVQGHLILKNALVPIKLGDVAVKGLFKNNPPKRLPALMLFNDLKETIEDMRDIQADEKNPNDCAKEPHDLTHNVDSLRYFFMSRQLPAEKEVIEYEDDETEQFVEYEAFICGGEPTVSYVGA